ncbi:MAG TPA: serine/threonine-protein kinase [Kineosporiaceae bacterium]|nr:serine/threonine-protein kinase [Kineosporiaceae bacterium]
MTDVSPNHPGGRPAVAQTSPGIQQILGDFDLLERVGEGGSAIVYRAVNRTFNGIVAVKVWRAPLTESQRHKFFDECNLQWKLSDHPNIVRLYWAGAPVGAPPWLATELYEMSLAQRALADPQLPRAELLNYADDILTGLAAVHAERMLHRDVKPANVLLKNGTAALGDLGITMHLDGWTRDGAAGTDSFLAPELVRGSPPNVRSDVFSAAVTIRYMFTDDLPPEIEAVLTRGASHDPRDRPADANALRDQLRAARAAAERREGTRHPPSTGGSAVWGTAPIQAAPTQVAPTPPAASQPPRSGRPKRSRPLSLILLAVVWALVLSVAAVAGFTAHQSASGSPGPSSLPAAGAHSYRPAPSNGNALDLPPLELEQCTPALRKNPQWVCLTDAVRSGSRLTLKYNSNFTPTASSSGHHIHIFTAHLGDDGSINPPDTVMGMQQQPASTQGSWWTDYQPNEIAIDLSKPADSPTHRSIDTEDPFVCVRAATQQHGLVRDLKGGYETGNCLRMSG